MKKILDNQFAWTVNTNAQPAQTVYNALAVLSQDFSFPPVCNALMDFI